jgi:tetratricopeptide (TPR) repeat protein
VKHVLILFILFTAMAASAQLTKIIIPAGTPEDQAIQAITNETDPQKRVALLQDLVQKFGSNAQAAAYGYWQLSQQYLNDGDQAKALEFGEKALTVQPGNLDILVSVADIAQRSKLNDKIVDCAVRGGTAFNGVAKQPKPADMTAEEFAARIKSEQDSGRSAYEYLEAAGMNAIVSEQDAKKRMSEIERYIAAFPGSRFEEQITQTAVYTLGQLNDSARLASFGEKALAANPNSVSMLVLLASAFAESSNPTPTEMTRAESYARKALEMSKAHPSDDERKQRMSTGLAHSALGLALLNQDKSMAAITELKTAATELKGDPTAYPAVLYRLGFAYAKTNKIAEAKAVLTEAVAIEGPYQAPSRELLGKVEAAAPKGRK